ncbi:hypothetical protein [Klebsiella quasipneumoniae]|uniref:hypothetical protein n=1 Tax=Klebsiella quasipneumoniae TaxID=1463165 RepID=UPI000DF0CF5F|nr:hypothetical protein [Klebsiella quasipneumoniae]
MANLSRLFSVKIGRQTTAAQYGVFGVGLILAPGAAFFGKKFTDYESAVVADFADLYVSIHRNSIDTGKMRRSSLDPTFLLA